MVAVLFAMLGVFAALMWRQLRHDPRMSASHLAAPKPPLPEVIAQPPTVLPVPIKRPPAITAVTHQAEAPRKPSDSAREINELLNRWAQAVRTRSATDQLTCYAPVLDRYFGRRHVALAELAANKQSVFASIGAVERFTIGAVKIQPKGLEEALTSFDKTWRFGGRRPFWGAAREQMTLRVYRGRWKIASENEIKVYSSYKAPFPPGKGS